MIHQPPVPVRLTAQADVIDRRLTGDPLGSGGTLAQITRQGKNNKTRKRTGALTKSTLSLPFALPSRERLKPDDPDLMKALLYGLIVWLFVEALASVYFRVWFNVGVDIAVLALFSVPLLKGLSKLQSEGH